jgi:nucleoside-diphosphate-sugar epimerase
MKILVTGHKGYVGSVLAQILKEAGHEVIGFDMYYFTNDWTSIVEFPLDVRDFTKLGSFDAIIHLAALSNDPMGEMNPELTYDINYRSTIRLARLAKEAGVRRFIFSSSCSVYGASDGVADEESPVCPLSAYAKSKLRAEEHLLTLGDEDFSPIILRNATAYGWSPNFRSDLVVNTMTCNAYAKKHINIVGDGKQWRPLVHVQDIAQAIILALEAPIKKVHNQIFNVSTGNYQVRAIANAVSESWPFCEITYSENKDIDPRSYQVNSDKIRELGFAPTWDIWSGIDELFEKFDELHLTDFSDYVRINKLKSLIAEGKLDKDLRWI